MQIDTPNGTLAAVFAIGGVVGAVLYRIIFAARWTGKVDATLKAHRDEIRALQERLNANGF